MGKNLIAMHSFLPFHCFWYIIFAQVDQVMRVERMRQAILEGVTMDYTFTKPTLPIFGSHHHHPGGAMHHPHHMGGHQPHLHSASMNYRPAGAPPGSVQPHRGNRGRGIMGRGPIDARGGQLQIAGVVVGSWGANTQAQQHRGQRHVHNMQQSQRQVLKWFSRYKSFIIYGWKFRFVIIISYTSNCLNVHTLVVGLCMVIFLWLFAEMY